MKIIINKIKNILKLSQDIKTFYRYSTTQDATGSLLPTIIYQNIIILFCLSWPQIDYKTYVK